MFYKYKPLTCLLDYVHSLMDIYRVPVPGMSSETVKCASILLVKVKNC